MEGFKVDSNMDLHDNLVHYVEHLLNSGAAKIDIEDAIANIDRVLADYKELTGDQKNIIGTVGKG